MILPFDKFNPRTLRAFEERIAEAFNAGKIKAPVHLSGGNELQLLEYFRTQVNGDDYVATTWRSHYHCLLKGVPEDVLFADILTGKSITLNYPRQRVISSAIVGGVVPIALGIAWAIKRGVPPSTFGNSTPCYLREDCKVHCFIGDMTARSGIVHECKSYAEGHQLPIHFVVENNGISVCTPTDEVWGTHRVSGMWEGATQEYSYHLDWPHSGAGKRVEF